MEEQMEIEELKEAPNLGSEPKSESSLVRDFTIAAGQDAPDVPTKVMTKEQINFICKMIIDEMLELCATAYTPSESKEMFKDLIDNAKEVPFNGDQGLLETIGEQHDAFVDIIYYIQNCAVKNGVNLSKLFKVVHEANMNKKDPKTGLFLKREDGKIIKPEGWKAPDITEEIRKQVLDGAWN